MFKYLKKCCVICDQPLNLGEVLYHSNCTNTYANRTSACSYCCTTGRNGVGHCQYCNGYGHLTQEATELIKPFKV